jgi:hypothetical protein
LCVWNLARCWIRRSTRRLHATRPASRWSCQWCVPDRRHWTADQVALDSGQHQVCHNSIANGAWCGGEWLGFAVQQSNASSGLHNLAAAVCQCGQDSSQYRFESVALDHGRVDVAELYTVIYCASIYQRSIHQHATVCLLAPLRERSDALPLLLLLLVW